MSSSFRRFENGILSRISGCDLDLLGPMQWVELAPHNALEVANREVESIYFIERGFASVVADDIDGGIIEVGLIGREGMTGLSVVHGAGHSPFSTFVQGAGSAVRIESDHLRSALRESWSLQQLFMRYAQAFAIQVASTASANGLLLLEQRVARWLLMVGDRLGESFQITHEFLAVMLAVRRAGVTRALQDLEARGLIRTMRGVVVITDREGLTAFTSGAYGVAEREYDALLSGLEISPKWMSAVPAIASGRERSRASPGIGPVTRSRCYFEITIFSSAGGSGGSSLSPAARPLT